MLDCSFKSILTEDEIVKLFNEFKNGDTVARDTLITHNLRLISYRVYGKFGSINYDKEELMSIGIIGLIKAVDTFDISRGKNFSTYAIRCIDNEILFACRKINRLRNVGSLDEILSFSFDCETRLVDIIGCSVDIEEEYIQSEMNKIYLEFISKLINVSDNQDIEIVKKYFGFYGRRFKQSEIADEFNISQTMVSRKITKCLRKIREYLELYDHKSDGFDTIFLKKMVKMSK